MKVKFGSIRCFFCFDLFCFVLFCLASVPLEVGKKNNIAVINKAVRHAVLLAVPMTSLNSLMRVSS